MLDEFNPSKPEPKAASNPSSQGRPPATDSPAEGMSNDDFAKQLQAGMADLLGELETSPDMQAEFENMLKELGGAAALGEAAGLGAAPASAKEPTGAVKVEPGSSGAATEESFQETIKKTMERMRASGDQATAAATQNSEEDFLAEMMKAMQAGGLDGEGGEEDFSKMLLGMMEQLTNKEILYEPMKELDDKFPDWIQKNAGKVDEADMKRYKEQQTYVSEIVKRFEVKSYSDDNAADREYIVERMQKVCGCHFITLDSLLILYRCKQPVHHQQILWETWQQRKKLSGLLKKVVLSNEQSSVPNTPDKLINVTLILGSPSTNHDALHILRLIA